jgi:hypothetical protein
MAEEILVKEALTQEMVDSGWELIRAIKDKEVGLAACFWLYSSEVNDWKLAFAMPAVDTEGPSKAYGIIHSVIRPSDRLFQIYWGNIVALGPSSRMVQSVLTVPMDANSSGARFKRSRLGDSFFDDVYIYNLAKLNGSQKT